MAHDARPERRDDPIGRVIAANIRQLRQQDGLTQQQLAERLAPFIGRQVTGAAIQQWEAGSTVRRFAVAELWAICRIFEVPLAALLLPNLGIGDPKVPELFDQSYSEIWNDCFARTRDWEASWLRITPSDDRPTPGPAKGPAPSVVESLGGHDAEKIALVIQILDLIERDR